MFWKVLFILIFLSSILCHDKFDLKRIKRNNNNIFLSPTSPTSDDDDDITLSDISELTSLLSSKYNFTLISSSSFFSDFLSSDSTSYNITWAIIFSCVFVLLIFLCTIAILIILIRNYRYEKRKQRKKHEFAFIG